MCSFVVKTSFVNRTQAVVSDDATLIPVNDPKSYTIADLVITLTFTETAPVFGTSSYSAVLEEKSPVGTAVPGLSFRVTSSNPVGLCSFHAIYCMKNRVFLVNSM